jgi:hypothetical protein
MLRVFMRGERVADDGAASGFDLDRDGHAGWRGALRFG